MATKPMAIWFRPWAPHLFQAWVLMKDTERRGVHRPACLESALYARIFMQSVCLCNFPGEIYVNKITNKIYNITIMCRIFESAFRAWPPFQTFIHSFIRSVDFVTIHWKLCTANLALFTPLCILNVCVWVPQLVCFLEG